MQLYNTDIHVENILEVKWGQLDPLSIVDKLSTCGRVGGLRYVHCGAE